MAVLTVFLTPDDGAGEILDVLHDLSGAGLLEPFVWLSGDTAARHDHVAIAVTGGRRVPTRLQDVVVDHRYERIRCCVLVPLAGYAKPLSGLLEQDVAALLSANAGGAPVVRARLLLTRGGTGEPDPEDVAHEGWHNVLVAPERSTGPGSGRWVLPTATSAADAAAELAPSVAGITGLWTGAPRCPLDGAPPAGRVVRAGRAFYRWVQAGQVEAELRARVLTTRVELPLPRQPQGATITYLADPGVACATMAGHLWGLHGYLLADQPGTGGPAARPASGSSLSWYPRYLLAAVRDDPRRWFRRVVARTTEAVPHRDQALMAGVLPPDHVAILHGTDAHGRPLAWDELGAIVDRIDSALPPLAAAAPLPDRQPDLPAFWRDYAGGALTLADAGDRGGQAMPPARTGSGRGVLRTTGDCVPGPDRDFVPGYGNLAAQAGIASVQAGDVLGADVLRRRLTWLAGERALTALTADAEITRRKLDEWERERSSTYVHHVGARLAARVNEVGDRLRAHLDALTRAATDPDELFRVEQRRQVPLSRAVLGVASAGLAILLVTIAAMVFVVGATVAASIVAVAALLLGAGGSAGLYALGQRRLFRTLRQRQQLIAQVEAAQPELRRTLREYRRLRDVYTDFLHWSRALAAVLEEPFGRAETGPGPGPATLRGLPPSTRIGSAVADPAIMPAAVATLRGDLFVTGWLTDPWRANLDLAVRRYSAGVHGPSPAPPEAHLGARGVSSTDPPLWTWAREIADDGPAAEPGHRASAAVLGSLSGPRADVGERLLSGIEPCDGRSGRPTPAEFMAGVDAPDRVSDDRFDPAHFSVAAQAADRTRVDASTWSGSRAGLSRVDVMVQLGEVFPAWDLAISDGDGEDGPLRRPPGEPSF